MGGGWGAKPQAAKRADTGPPLQTHEDGSQPGAAVAHYVLGERIAERMRVWVSSEMSAGVGSARTQVNSTPTVNIPLARVWQWATVQRTARSGPSIRGRR